MLRLQLCFEARVDDYFIPLETWSLLSDTRQEHMIVGIAKSAGHACEWNVEVSFFYMLYGHVVRCSGIAFRRRPGELLLTLTTHIDIVTSNTSLNGERGAGN